MTIREYLDSVIGLCRVAASDHNPWPLQSECIECGFRDPCPTRELAEAILAGAVEQREALNAADMFYSTGGSIVGRHYGDPRAVHRMVPDPLDADTPPNQDTYDGPTGASCR